MQLKHYYLIVNYVDVKVCNCCGSTLNDVNEISIYGHTHCMEKL